MMDNSELEFLNFNWKYIKCINFWIKEGGGGGRGEGECLFLVGNFFNF